MATLHRLKAVEHSIIRLPNAHGSNNNPRIFNCSEKSSDTVTGYIISNMFQIDMLYVVGVLFDLSMYTHNNQPNDSLHRPSPMIPMIPMVD